MKSRLHILEAVGKDEEIGAGQTSDFTWANAGIIERFFFALSPPGREETIHEP